jgi:peroxiredoxin
VAGLVVAGPAGIVWVPVVAGALALAAALAFQAWFSLQLLRQNGRVLARLDAIEPRLGDGPAAAPPRLEEGALAVFTDPGCAPCRALLPEIATWRHRLDVVVVSRGADPAAAELGLETVVQSDDTLARAFGVSGTPSAALVGPGGRPAGPGAAGAPAIRALVEHATSRPAPEFDLPDLDGRRVRLRDLRGERVLLLFWNPGCGFCRRMADELRTLAAGLRVVLVAGGGAEANRALGLPATVLLDDDGAVAAAFGARGTPMGVLIDERGRIASALAGGAPAVLALARAPSSADAA